MAAPIKRVASSAAAAAAKRSRAATSPRASAGAGSGGRAVPESAADFVKFVDASPSPFHAVQTCVARLEAAGFTPLSERAAWGTPCDGAASTAVKAGGKYYVTRNQSTVFAFAVGNKYKPGNGVSIVAAHTDSPCLKVKPRSALTKSGYLSVGVQPVSAGHIRAVLMRCCTLPGRACRYVCVCVCTGAN